MSGYAICRRCSAVYPERDGCAACDAPAADQGLVGTAADPFVVAADPPVEPMARRVRRFLHRSVVARWLIHHSVTIGLLVLATVTLVMVVVRAGS